jgi:hypothetical protein
LTPWKSYDVQLTQVFLTQLEREAVRTRRAGERSQR